MKKLKLRDIAQVAEVVAAVGVIISLIYVGVGVKDNTAAVRAATVQSITNSSREVLVAVALDEDFARIRQLGESDWTALTDAEAFRFFQFNRQNWLYFQNVWIQWTLGVADDRVWWSFERVICSLVHQPGVWQEWPIHREVLDPEFVAVVEECSK